ncbi:MAG: hypothetical protein RLZZ244_2076 [Verrucomicrobiota bacterium]|jgi:hypothetical protein
MKNSLLLMTVASVLCLGSSACIFIGNKAIDTTPRNTGAELLDLKKAKDQGLLSTEEYRKQREHILSESNAKKDSEKK